MKDAAAPLYKMYWLLDEAAISLGKQPGCCDEAFCALAVWRQFPVFGLHLHFTL